MVYILKHYSFTAKFLNLNFILYMGMVVWECFPEYVIVFNM